MKGTYLTPKTGDVQTAYPLFEIISFKVIPLTSERIEVISECNQPVVQEFFLTLLSEIANRWPQSEDIGFQLEELKLLKVRLKFER